MSERVTKRNPQLPDISVADVLASGRDASRVLVTYGEGVFDITDFVAAHPGGEQILLAAGGPLEPFFDAYKLHDKFFVHEMLLELRVGNLVRPRGEHDDKLWAALLLERRDAAGLAAYAGEPLRSPRLIVRSDRPFTAETPPDALVHTAITPNELFYVRNHMAVPHIDPDDYELVIEGVDGEVLAELSLDDLKNKFSKHSVTTALQCAGNRRTELDAVRAVRGGRWDAGAIGNAEWSGARLTDVLAHAQGVSGQRRDDDKQTRHICFEGLDEDAGSGTRYAASIPVDVLRRVPDVLLAYEMNGETLPRDHGFPVRAVVPGVVGARNVKWVGRVSLSTGESDSHWQRRDYRCVDDKESDDEKAYAQSPSIQETPVVSAICDASLDEARATASATGYAVGAAGQPVVRVQLSIDGGSTWTDAQLHPTRPHARDVFDWTLWSVELQVPPDVAHHGEAVLLCRAEDAAAQRQPRELRDVWNARGLLNNSWHAVRVQASAHAAADAA
ncbi:unnamed protein product [Agarophyton chilense]